MPKKAPWQMTKTEFETWYKENFAVPDLQGHKLRVKLALEQGKPVPVEVLKDYPELKPGNLMASAIVRISKKELTELIESVEAAGGDATDLKALLTEVESDERRRGIGGRSRGAAPTRGGLQTVRGEEMTTQEYLEHKVGDLFDEGITGAVLETLFEMDRDHSLQDLRRMCVKAGLSTNGDKKTLAAKLLACHYLDRNPDNPMSPLRIGLGGPGEVYGRLTPPLMEEIKSLVEAVEWPPPEEPSPTFSTVLQVIDYAYPLKALQMMCIEHGISKNGHKKKLAARLLLVEDEEVTALAERTIAELEARGNEDKERTLEEVTEIARKVVRT